MRKFFLLFAAIAVLAASERVATIVETDIGQYMDDTWALAALLADKNLDVQMIVLSTNNTLLRAKIVAKLLQDSEYSAKDITLVIGNKDNDYAGPQSEWAKDYDLANYPGPIITDQDCTQVVAAQMKKALVTGGRVMLVELAPPVVFGDLAVKYGDLLNNKKVFMSMMGGSFYYTYQHAHEQGREYNVRFNITASKNLFNSAGSKMAPDHFMLSPLDTAGIVRIEYDLWQYFLINYASSKFLENLLLSYHEWSKYCPLDPYHLKCSEGDPRENSGVLYDAEAAVLASAMIHTDGSSDPNNDPFFRSLKKSVVRMYVDDEGYTKIDESKSVSYAQDRTVAMAFSDAEKFIELLLARVLKVV